ncbi:DNA-binding protein [Paenibacillus sp. PK3_47]|nr:DNA-binding protein [Paenibacillus sp. PK3_47]
MLELGDMNADSLTDMLKASFSLHNWTAMIEIADKLFGTVAVIHGTSSQGIEARGLRRSLAYYFGFSLCAKGIALQKMGNYARARECISKYSDLSWTRLDDEESLSEIEFYKSTAIANAYVIEILEGNTKVLPEYVEFLKVCDREELTAGLMNILDSALKFSYSVDWALEELQRDVEKVSAESPEVDVRYYIDFVYLLSVYLYKRGKTVHAINLALENIVLSSKLGDGTGFQKAIAFYELVRADASADQQQEYHYIMKKIIEREFNDEKEAFVVDNRIAD